MPLKSLESLHLVFQISVIFKNPLYQGGASQEPFHEPRHSIRLTGVFYLLFDVYILTLHENGAVLCTLVIDADFDHIIECMEPYRLVFFPHLLQKCFGTSSSFLSPLKLGN